MNTTYAEAYAERWPTPEQVEQEAYGRRPRETAPKPPKPKASTITDRTYESAAAAKLPGLA